jgi:hypothetical protein
MQNFKPSKLLLSCGDTATNFLEYFGGRGHLYVKFKKKEKKKAKDQVKKKEKIEVQTKDHA